MFKKARQARKAKAPKEEVITADMFVHNDPEFAASHGYDPYLISQTQPMGNLHFSCLEKQQSEWVLHSRSRTQ